MKTKIIYFPDHQVERISNDALEHEISFTEMVRRIIDTHYDGSSAIISEKPDKGKKQ